jgi:hypothetical protein
LSIRHEQKYFDIDTIWAGVDVKAAIGRQGPAEISGHAEFAGHFCRPLKWSLRWDL